MLLFLDFSKYLEVEIISLAQKFSPSDEAFAWHK
uniref:Uncharacterized protein n=1 Tax=Arundo donax TaxID=35708 RepID=A0A0A8YAA6_ARUDO